MTRPIPYPADVRAKGWRFELDHEKIRQSDTWTLAKDAGRPWLLMLWMVAWEQTPCGSLPNDDELIAARIGMSIEMFTSMRGVLLRRWYEAEDGRLYHETMTMRVLEMITKRRSESDRKARKRAQTDEDGGGNPPVVPPDNPGTEGGLPRESDTRTRTSTSTSTSKEEIPPATRSTPGSVGVGEQSSTKAGEVCQAIRAKGIADAKPSNLRLQALIGKGVALEAFEAAAAVCARFKPPKGIGYLLAIVEREVGEAAAIAAGPGVQGKPWDADRPSIEAKAAELGLKPWNESDLSVDRETFPAFTARVRRAVNERQGVPA